MKISTQPVISQITSCSSEDSSSSEDSPVWSAGVLSHVEDVVDVKSSSSEVTAASNVSSCSPENFPCLGPLDMCFSFHGLAATDPL